MIPVFRLCRASCLHYLLDVASHQAHDEQFEARLINDYHGSISPKYHKTYTLRRSIALNPPWDTRGNSIASTVSVTNINKTYSEERWTEGTHMIVMMSVDTRSQLQEIPEIDVQTGKRDQVSITGRYDASRHLPRVWFNDALSSMSDLLRFIRNTQRDELDIQREIAGRFIIRRRWEVQDRAKYANMHWKRRW